MGTNKSKTTRPARFGGPPVKIVGSLEERTAGLPTRRSSDARGKDPATTRTVTIRGEVIPNPAGRNFNMNPNEIGMAEIRRISRADQLSEALQAKVRMQDERRASRKQSVDIRGVGRVELPPGNSIRGRLEREVLKVMAMETESGALPAGATRAQVQLHSRISSMRQAMQSGTGALPAGAGIADVELHSIVSGVVNGPKVSGAATGSVERTSDTRTEQPATTRTESVKGGGGGGPDEYNRDEQGRFAPK